MPQENEQVLDIINAMDPAIVLDNNTAEENVIDNEDFITAEEVEKPAETEETEETPKYNVQELLDRHEQFKAKGLQLTDEDLFDRLSLMDEIIAVVWDMKAKRTENKLEQDKDKALRSIELKMEKDAAGKTLNTDKMIEALIKTEFYEKDLEQSTLKVTYDLLYQRAGVINDLVNVVKMHKKADFTL